MYIYRYIQKLKQTTNLFAHLRRFHIHRVSRQVMFSSPIFIVAEVVFSVYFTAEVIVRYMIYTSTMKLGAGNGDGLERHR